jgi:imidazolonepropionase-like amidohydrolase
MGQISPGMEADLVLLRKNPLVDIRHSRSIEAVISNGIRVR